MAKLHRARNALHTTTFLGVSAKFTTQSPGVSAKFPAAKLTTTKLTSHQIPPSHCITFSVTGITRSTAEVEGGEVKRSSHAHLMSEIVGSSERHVHTDCNWLLTASVRWRLHMTPL